MSSIMAGSRVRYVGPSLRGRRSDPLRAPNGELWQAPAPTYIEPGATGLVEATALGPAALVLEACGADGAARAYEPKVRTLIRLIPGAITVVVDAADLRLEPAERSDPDQNQNPDGGTVRVPFR